MKGTLEKSHLPINNLAFHTIRLLQQQHRTLWLRGSSDQDLVRQLHSSSVHHPSRNSKKVLLQKKKVETILSWAELLALSLVYTQRCSRTQVGVPNEDHLVARFNNKMEERFASRYRESLLEAVNVLKAPWNRCSLIHAFFLTINVFLIFSMVSRWKGILVIHIAQDWTK